jgi:hypothetical protein
MPLLLCLVQCIGSELCRSFLLVCVSCGPDPKLIDSRQLQGKGVGLGVSEPPSRYTYMQVSRVSMSRVSNCAQRIG